jgi:hypothetical protein
MLAEIHGEKTWFIVVYVDRNTWGENMINCSLCLQKYMWRKHDKLYFILTGIHGEKI